MKNYKKISQSKGSVLIAVIGVLAVLSIMALRFNAEMETAMIKTAGKNISSDVKVIANSGLEYAITKILENGQSCNGSGGAIAGFDHVALRIEEDMEFKNKGSSTLPIDFGSGIGNAPKYFSFSYFFGGTKSTLSTSYIPETDSLAPGNINFMIEDLSGKLPMGHVSQYFQRLLISATLSKLLTGTVPLNFNAELFEDTNSTEVGGYDDYQGSSIYLRSLVPFEVAKTSSPRRDTAGLPIADGNLVPEEYGASYSWVNGGTSPSEKKHSTDSPKSASHYLLLNSSLTPFSRFSFYDSNVSYASLNPMVMSQQNERLYKALFNFEPDDNKLKMYFSVSFPPKDIKNDDVPGKKAAIADATYFELNCGNILATPMPSTTIVNPANPALPFAYNARDIATDTRPKFTDPNFLASDKASLIMDTKRSWSDGEFSAAPKAVSAYYIAMDKAVERLARAFKGTKVHDQPAENVMNPVMTRQTLELAIIKAVFGDSILFVINDDHDNDNGAVTPARKVFFNNYGANTGSSSEANKPGEVNYFRMLRAIEKNEIDLADIKLVENAFSDSKNDKDMAKKYFVPAWKDYKNDVTGAKFDVAITPFGSIEIPAFGLHYASTGKYVNYLPHPYSDQRALANTYVTVAAAYSKENSASVANPGTTAYNVFKLYQGISEPVKGCKMAASDANEAFMDISTLPGAAPVISNSAPLPADSVKLYYVDSSDTNFKPADFSPYETKIRMAVLVNLLNAIIPKTVTKSSNFALNANDSLFSAIPSGAATNLKDFIGCSGGEYRVSANANFLNFWPGGVQTPGMTFWKYGVHSTTFQVTVDAFKYEDSARLSAVVTFDLDDDDGVKLGNKTSYDIDPLKATLNSTIYLNPKGRYKASTEKFGLGNGKTRYPNVTDTDSWRILSFVWSSPFARGVVTPDYFAPIILYPETVVNIGADGGSWHFERHPLEATLYDKFYYGPNYYYDPGGRYNQMVSTGGSRPDYTIDTVNGTTRKYAYGKNSWLKWQATFTMSMPANSLELNFERAGGDANSGYIQKHQVDIIKASTNKVVYSLSFDTVSNWGYQQNYPFTIPVAIDGGQYFIKLTELKDSCSTHGPERFISLRISQK